MFLANAKFLTLLIFGSTNYFKNIGMYLFLKIKNIKVIKKVEFKPYLSC